MGLDSHPWQDADPNGVAVSQFDPPADRDDPRVHEAVKRWGLGPEAIARITTELTCATDGRWKLMRRGEVEELYDLESDPLELEPLVPDTQRDHVVEPLRVAMDHERRATPVTGPPACRPKERMSLLGYTCDAPSARVRASTCGGERCRPSLPRPPPRR